MLQMTLTDSILSLKPSLSQKDTIEEMYVFHEISPAQNNISELNEHCQKKKVEWKLVISNLLLWLSKDACIHESVLPASNFRVLELQGIIHGLLSYLYFSSFAYYPRVLFLEL